MTYRIRRKFISSKFTVDKNLCKLFLDPFEYNSFGFCNWNVGFAVGKSNRQLNDWYQERGNKRRRSIHQKITGRSGMKVLFKALDHLLKLRWHIPAGDTLILDCTSANPDKQFKVWGHVFNKRPDWTNNPELKEYYWTRPPYPVDPIWKQFRIVDQLPSDLKASVSQENYFDYFLYYPLKQDN